MRSTGRGKHCLDPTILFSSIFGQIGRPRRKKADAIGRKLRRADRKVPDQPLHYRSRALFRKRDVGGKGPLGVGMSDKRHLRGGMTGKIGRQPAQRCEIAVAKLCRTGLEHKIVKRDGAPRLKLRADRRPIPRRDCRGRLRRNRDRRGRGGADGRDLDEAALAGPADQQLG